MQRPPRHRHLLVSAAQHPAIERRLQRAIAPRRGDLQMGPARLGQDLSQRDQAQARHRAARDAMASRQLAHQRRGRQHRHERAVAAFGDQRPAPPPGGSLDIDPEAAAVGAEAAQALGDRRQARRERRQRAHQAQPHQPAQQPQPEMQHRELEPRAGIGVAHAEALREEPRLGQLAGRHPARAEPRHLHAPRRAPHTPAGLVGDRLAGARQDRLDQRRTARRVVARHDAEAHALDAHELARRLDHRAGERRRRAGAAAHQHARRLCRLIELVDAADEGRIVGEVEIVHAVPDAGLGHGVVLPLERPGDMDQRIEALLAQHAIEIAPPVERQRRRCRALSPAARAGRARAPAAVTARRGSSASSRHSRLPNTPLPPRTRTLNGVTVSR